MEYITEFIRSMTIWNWLQLFAVFMAVILFLPSAISHWLNLYPKYKDWKAVKSQKAFDKRLSDLKYEFNFIKSYRESPVALVELLDEASPIVILFLLSIGAFFVAFHFYSSDTQLNSWRREIGWWLLTFAVMFIFHAIKYFIKFRRVVLNIRLPIKLAEEIITLLNEGKAKKLIVHEEKELIDSLVDSGLFTETGKKAIREHYEKTKALTSI